MPHGRPPGPGSQNALGSRSIADHHHQRAPAERENPGPQSQSPFPSPPPPSTFSHTSPPATPADSLRSRLPQSPRAAGRRRRVAAEKVPSDSSPPRPADPLMMALQQQQQQHAGSASGSASASSSSSGLHPLSSPSSFADTTHTKVFVGGLAWETNSDRLHRFYERFGDILEAVVITDRHSGRSKGYGFVGASISLVCAINFCFWVLVSAGIVSSCDGICSSSSPGDIP